MGRHQLNAADLPPETPNEYRQLFEKEFEGTPFPKRDIVEIVRLMFSDPKYRDVLHLSGSSLHILNEPVVQELHQSPWWHSQEVLPSSIAKDHWPFKIV